MKNRLADRRLVCLCVLMLFLVAGTPLTALAQGSIYGTVQNSDLSTPANGEISFFGFLDNTDEEIRTETSTGAGYDAGYWFDDFQNYLTEAAGNPYDHYLYNVSNGEGFHLADVIPNNSFQEEDLTLAAVVWPAQPTGLAAAPVSAVSVVLSWDMVAGLTYHVYRRPSSSTGSFFRIDDPSGSLTNPGVGENYFVDNGVDGASSYSYLILAEDGSGNYSEHSEVLTINSSALVGPTVASIDPPDGLSIGGTSVTISGSEFDMAGLDVTIGGASLTGIAVVSPYQITGTTPAGAGGAADVAVTNTASGLGNTLVGGFTYNANTPPVLAAIGPQNQTEGLNLNFMATATDVDGGNPVMTSSALPGDATFTDNGDGTATFDWTPNFFDAGTYNVTFYATDDVAPSLIDSEQVVITVDEAGNQLPVLAAIGPQTATEDVLLTVNVSATDVESTPTLTTSTLPTGASFTDNGDGTGAFTWTPDFTQGGMDYDVTFYATDDSSAVVSELVTITVNDGGNQLPVLAAIGPQGADENVPLSFGVSASDIDGVTPLLSTSTLPGTAGFVDNGDGTGTFDWTPTYDDSGTYVVTFYATDGAFPSAIDSEEVTITITNVNREVVLAAIGAQTLTENAPFSLPITASDPDGDFAVFSSTTLPGTASLLDNGDGTATFDWTPSYSDSGTYAVTFYATDGAFPSVIDSEEVTITVANTNRMPELAAIGAQSGSEEALLTFGVSAGDLDGDTPLLTTSALPTGADFVDNGDGTGTFDWTPALDQQGTHLVTFYATDGAYPGDVDSELVSISVGNVNQPPVLAAIGAQGGTEGVLLSIPVSATDPDGTFQILTSTTPPTGAVMTDNGDGTGSFDWTPDFMQAGEYEVRFYADDGEFIDSEIVTITIVEAGNQAPDIDPIPPQAASEGDPVGFTMTAVDPEGATPTLWAAPLPDGASFIDNGDGTGDFSWMPDYTQAGSHEIFFYASDGVATDSVGVTFDIGDAGNQAPTLAAIGSQGTTENIPLGFVVNAEDPDGTIPVLTTSTLPTGANFVDNADGTGAFDWLPDFTQAGPYQITFYADDGEFIDSEQVAFDIADNQAPVLDPIGDRSIAEGGTLAFPITAGDPDGTFPAITSATLPSGAILTDAGDGSATFEWTPSYLQGGDHSVTFSAEDGEFSADETITISVVEAGDQPPVFVAIPDTAVNEGGVLVINVSASDPEGGSVALTVSTNLTHYTFVDHHDGTAVLTYSPTFYDAGVKTVIFFATEIGGTGLASSETVVITTVDVNQPPIFDPLGPFAMVIFDTLEFTVTVHDSTDPDVDHVVFLPTDGLPENASWADNGDHTGTFTFIPVWGQDGDYEVTFWAVDQGTPPLSASLPVSITVQNDNLPPEVDQLGPQAVFEGEELVLTLTASDPDGATPPEVLADTVHLNASFVDNGDGTATYTFNPSFVQSGLYSVTFGAYDGIDTTWADATLIQVREAGNQVPVFDPFPTLSVTEGESLEDFISGSDPDLSPVSFSVVEASQPENFTLVDSGNGVAGVFFSPSYVQAGIYDIQLVISDGQLADTAVLTVEVIEAGNQMPVLDAIVDYTVNENVLLQFTVTASDIDGPPPDLSTSVLPGTAAFDGPTGLFSWTPSYDDSGAYTITFYATDVDDPTAIDSQGVVITVVDVNRTPWYLIPPVYQEIVDEGDSLVFTITAWDNDGSFPVMDAYLDASDELAPNMTFTQETVGTEVIGTLVFKPDFTQGNGDPTFYYVRFRIEDEFDEEIFRITGTVTFRVFDVNQPPYLDFTSGVGPFEIDEGENISFNVFGFDDDDDDVTIWAENLPDSNYYVNQPEPHAIIFSFSPDYSQSGLYQITFWAEDVYGLTVSQMIEITVSNGGNHIPVFQTTLPDTVDVYSSITYDVTIVATDPEGDPVLLTAAPVPTNASWDTTGGVGQFQFTSQADQIGQVYAVDFVAEDLEAAMATMTVNFRVNNFMRGDTDDNDVYTLNDVIFLAGYMFRSGSEPAPIQAADVDDSGQLDVADLAYLVNYMYHAGPRPPQ